MDTSVEAIFNIQQINWTRSWICFQTVEWYGFFFLNYPNFKDKFKYVISITIAIDTYKTRKREF